MVTQSVGDWAEKQRVQAPVSDKIWKVCIAGALLQHCRGTQV